ncbi:MAG: hypothetical protein J7M27_06550 [Candidatus Latescibacteria bacterium]|nr:hypothetical protein [Candidatus Latescibacterota bacterium]
MKDSIALNDGFFIFGLKVLTFPSLLFIFLSCTACVRQVGGQNSTAISRRDAQRGKAAKKQKQWDTDITDFHGSNKATVNGNPNKSYHSRATKILSKNKILQVCSTGSRENPEARF